MSLEFKALNDAQCALGEGPAYDERRNALWYCDIVGRAILCHDLNSGQVKRWTFATEVGSLGLAESGRLVVAMRQEVGIFDPDTGDFAPIAAIEDDNPDTRLNDGKVGPDGAFWVGTMDDSDRAVKEPVGALYRVDPSGRVEKKVDGLLVSNGLAFSLDGRTMLHSDSRGAWIDRWDLDPNTGAIGNRTRIASLDEATGRPDGGAADCDGYYWSAGVSAGRLNRFTRDGDLASSYPLPVAAPTMPCFGGPDYKSLFVTSLRVGRDPDLLARYPLTGTVIVANSPVAGVPVGRFRDT